MADDTESNVMKMYCANGIRAAIIRAALAACIMIVASQARADASTPHDVGRLFLTPAQRAELDAERRRVEPAETTVSVTRPDAVRLREDIVLNGIIRRSRGPATVWINGRTLDRETAELAGVDLRRGPDEQSRVSLSTDDGRAVALKPGQVWLRESGRIVECANCVPRDEPPAPAEPERESP